MIVCAFPVVSLWTTAAGRIHLHGLMKRVEETPGCRMLYTDTDSLIYVHPRGRNPLPTGGHLGQLTNELPEHDIDEYCSAGPKQYGVALWRKDGTSVEREHQLKIKGFTLNWDAIHSQGFRYRDFRNRVYKYTRTGEVLSRKLRQKRKIQPQLRNGTVISLEKIKTQRPYYCKGIVVPDGFRILDFGYNPDFDSPITAANN